MKSTCSQGQCMFSWLFLSVLSNLRFYNFYFKPWQTFVDWENVWNRCHLWSSPRTPYHWALSPSPEDHTPWLRRNEIRAFPVVQKPKKRSPNFGVACLWMVDEDNAWMMRMLFHDIWCHLQYFDPRKVRAMQMQWHHKPFSQPHRFKFTFKVIKTWSPTTFVDTGYIPISVKTRCLRDVVRRTWTELKSQIRRLWKWNDYKTNLFVGKISRAFLSTKNKD